MGDLDSEWQRKGATLSDKTARTEFGLTQDEIVQEIRAGKLHYRVNSMFGEPLPAAAPARGRSGGQEEARRCLPEGPAGEDGVGPHQSRAEAARDPDGRVGRAEVEADGRLGEVMESPMRSIKEGDR